MTPNQDPRKTFDNFFSEFDSLLSLLLYVCYFIVVCCVLYFVGTAIF